MASPPDRADVTATAVLAIVADALRSWWINDAPINRAEVRRRVADRLRDEFADLERQLADDRAGAAAMTARGYAYDDAIVEHLVAADSAVARLIQETTAAHCRREGAALLAAFDLTQIPRRCLGALQRHLTNVVNELPD